MFFGFRVKNDLAPEPAPPAKAAPGISRPCPVFPETPGSGAAPLSPGINAGA